MCRLHAGVRTETILSLDPARAVTARRFVLCTTPAQGHTAPLVALARRLVDDGHEVVFFTTEHYRDSVEGTGARFVPFADEDDAHDLMVANPERESSSKRGVGGVKDDLRRIFIGPLPGQSRDLRAILDDFDADCIVVDSMFLGALPNVNGACSAKQDVLNHAVRVLVTPAYGSHVRFGRALAAPGRIPSAAGSTPVVVTV